ncbi:hypothetical protein IEO21_10205 [Rhodonia placenta]|uniref:Uncharacterized protein n=1 Tax=Rhodonia placenta TaxID=104341 RepID=A0A8H7NSY0_9APHY|nr:hypothetical protein IEO21_10205 [Postia placenta]
MVALPSTESEASMSMVHDMHMKFYTAPEPQEDQAEEWNKMRAQQSELLVQLPPDLQISVLFEKHGRAPFESVIMLANVGPWHLVPLTIPTLPLTSDLEVHLPGTRARSRRAKITDAQYNRVLKPSKKPLTKVRGKVSVVAPMGEIKHKDSEYN